MGKRRIAVLRCGAWAGASACFAEPICMLSCLILGAMATAEPTLEELFKQVSPERLKATVEKLASWNTRNTNTPQLTEAAEWIAGEYRKIPGIQVELFKYKIVASRRVPEDKEVVEVVAVLPGKTDRRILVGGHFDTINLSADVFTGRAPGANDDGSGTSLALELARVMSARKWTNTLVFCAFSGEEQGLLGSRALSQRAKAENWLLKAVFSNDIVGSSSNKNGQKDNKHIRIFSEEWQPGAQSSAAGQATRPQHNARELARLIEWEARKNLRGFSVKLVFRRDRFGRGGDHTSFTEEGFNAVRFTEMHEEYSHQHNADDLPQYMDFDYLANVARANMAGMAALADAGPASANVRMVRDQGHNTLITWAGQPGVRYTVYWRETTSPVWQQSRKVGAVERAVFEKLSVDDYVFAVGAEGGIPVVAR